MSPKTVQNAQEKSAVTHANAKPTNPGKRARPGPAQRRKLRERAAAAKPGVTNQIPTTDGKVEKATVQSNQKPRDGGITGKPPGKGEKPKDSPPHKPKGPSYAELVAKVEQLELALATIASAKPTAINVTSKVLVEETVKTPESEVDEADNAEDLKPGMTARDVPHSIAWRLIHRSVSWFLTWWAWVWSIGANYSAYRFFVNMYNSVHWHKVTTFYDGHDLYEFKPTMWERAYHVFVDPYTQHDFRWLVLLVFLLSATLYLKAMWARRRPNKPIDLIRECTDLAHEQGIDVELLAYLMNETAFNGKTTLNLKECKFKARQWITMNRKSWSQLETLQQVAKAVAVCSGYTPFERALLDYWTLSGFVAGMHRATSAFVRGILPTGDVLPAQ